MTATGDPVTKGRPRVKSGGGAYTPRKTKEAEEAFRWALREAGLFGPPDGDHLLAVYLAFRTATAQRRDVDNLVKLVLDACNGIVWEDDFQVVELHATVERRSPEPGTTLRVSRVGRYSRDCAWCGYPIGARVGSTRDKGTYCSRGCYDEAQRLGEKRACSNCGAEVYRQRSSDAVETFCSDPCRSEHLRGKPRAPGAWQAEERASARETIPQEG